MSVIGVLGIPSYFLSRFNERTTRLGGRWEEDPGATVKKLRGGLLHLPSGRETLTAAFAELCAIMRLDSSIRLFCQEILPLARYKPDPRCLIVSSCDTPPCARLCGDDQWSTPQYQKANTGKKPWTEDCDGIELCVSGMGRGLPLFVPPERGKMGHVLHCEDDALGKTSRASDFCIPAGMRQWRGPRECYVHLPGDAQRWGTIYEVDIKNGNYIVYWR